MPTIAQLKKTLTEKQIAFKSKARKAELIALLPPPPVEVAPSPLELLFAEKVADREGGRGINNYVYQHPNGELRSGFGAACYARLQNTVPVTGLIIDISYHFNSLQGAWKEHYPEWITGMLRDSMFSVAFREKSFEEAMKSGVHLNVDTCTSHVCIAAAVALRGYHEVLRYAVNYAILRKLDIPFTMKWFFSIVLLHSKNGWKSAHGGSNHCVIDRAVEKEVICKNLQEGLKEDPKLAYAVKGSGYQIFRTVGGKISSSLEQFLQQFVPYDHKFLMKDVWSPELSIPNHFYSDQAVMKLSEAILSYKPREIK